MLKRVGGCVLAAVGLSIGFLSTSVSWAEEPCQEQGVSSHLFRTVSVCVSDETTTEGETSSSGNGTTANSSEVDWLGDRWWSPEFKMYCKAIEVPTEGSWSDELETSSYKPGGVLYSCAVPGASLKHAELFFYEDAVVPTPPKPGTDPAGYVRTAVASLGLKPPTVGVGAFVYDRYEEWGLSWWVGAPMWLWVDDRDDLQWGTHEISGEDAGLSVSASVRATSVSFDPGNGDDPVVCQGAGTVRVWDPRAPLAQHSPSGCEYTYRHSNELGDVDSRFEVSATVTWTVSWQSSDGQSGSFTLEVASVESASIHVGEIHIVTTAS